MDFLFNHLKLMLFEKVTRENIFQIKDFNVMIDGKTFFNQPVKNNLRTYDNIQEIANGPGDDYTTGCLLGCLYFKNYYKMIAVDLSKQQEPDADPKAI